MQGPTNSILWSGLMTFVTDLIDPVIIAGDFNVAPEEFMTTSLAGTMQVSDSAAGEQTSELDWALVSNELIADMSISANWEVPYRPHCQMKVTADPEIPTSPGWNKSQWGNMVTSSPTKRHL